MPNCPNCGRVTGRTKDWACPWCGYPLTSKSYKPLEETYREIKGGRPLEYEAEVDTYVPVAEPEAAPEIESPIEVESEPMVAAKTELELEVKPEYMASEEEPELEVAPEEESEALVELEGELAAVTEPEPEVVAPEPKPKRKRAAKPKAKAEPEPEPESELAPEVKAEAVAELEEAVAELETMAVDEVAEVKPKPKRRFKAAEEPKPAAEPEATVGPEPEAEAESETGPGPEPEAAPEAEISPVAEAEPVEMESEVEPGLVQVSIEGLHTAFQSNAEAADAKYRGKMLKLTGLLYRTVINDNLDVAYIILTSAKKFGDWKVSCTFSKQQEGELRRLDEGSMVTVQGKYDGYRVNVQMRDCVIVH